MDEGPEEIWLGGTVVARLLGGVDTSTVYRIDKSLLDYGTTPGGHRRYRASDVITYARDHLHIEITPTALDKARTGYRRRTRSN